MKFNVSLFIALRYWRAKTSDRFGRLVTYLATIGIILGVSALIIVMSIMNGLEQQQKQQLLTYLPHAIILPKEGFINKNDTPPNLPTIVNNITPINESKVILQSSKGISAGEIIGVNHLEDDPLLQNEQNAYLDFNSILSAGDFNIILGAALANKLAVQIGDKVRVMLVDNSQYTPLGRVPVQRLFKVSYIYQTQNEVSNYLIFANLSDIGRLMRVPLENFQGYRLFLQDPFKVTQLNTSFSPEQWKIKDWRAQKGEFFQAVSMEKNMMGLLISLIIIVAVSNIITSLSLMVIDKQGEIAILQTQGLNKRQIWLIFIYQGMLVGGLGTLIGVILGVIITLNLGTIINIINPMNIYLPTQFNGLQVGIVVILSLFLSFISTIYPAYRASKIEPAEALRYE